MDSPLQTAAHLRSLVAKLSETAKRVSRPDLVNRLEDVERTLADTSVTVVVVGQFKQGKSALVNSLVSAKVCPIDDVVATAVPTFVRWGSEVSAALVTVVGGETHEIRTPVDPAQLRHHVTELASAPGGTKGLHAEVLLPRKLLAGGLVFVDTPGVGRPQHRAATNLGLIPQADVVVVVTDATQELTEPELSFVSQAAELCPRIVCVVSKSDLQLNWRSIVAANTSHLAAAGVDAHTIVTSALLHDLAASRRDNEMLEEAGVLELARHLNHQRRKVLRQRHLVAAEELRAVAGLLQLVFTGELDVLGNPADGETIVYDLVQAEERAERLTRLSARWQQTLADGSAELQDDIDFDLRDRMRAVVREAEQLIDTSDPGKSWEEIGLWLADSVSQAVSDNFVWAHTRSMHLAEVVSRHFVLDGRAVMPELSLAGTERALAAIGALDFVKSGELTLGQKVMFSLKASYGGVLMFGLMTTLAGLALVNPISIAAGLIMGGFAYRQNSTQRLEQRRAEAKAAVRRLNDEAIFQVAKESRDRLASSKRVLRDHFLTVAESFKLSLADSIRLAKQSAQLPQTERGRRLGVLREELRALRAVSEASELLAAPTAPIPRQPGESMNTPNVREARSA